MAPTYPVLEQLLAWAAYNRAFSSEIGPKSQPGLTYLESVTVKVTA